MGYMESKISLFASVYVLMSMFLSMYIFASNSMALGMALVFGSILVISPYYVFRDHMKRFKESCKDFLLKFRNTNS
jgi:hypothetical protein